jgi:PAS domain-containing protein
LLALFHAFSTKCAQMRRAVNEGDDQLAYALDRELGPLFDAIVDYRANSTLEIYMQLQFIGNVIRDEAEDRASVVRNAHALSILVDRYFAGSGGVVPDSLVVLPPMKKELDGEQFDRSRLLNDTLLDSLPDRVVVVTRDYRYLYSNAANGKYLNIKPIDLIGHHIMEFIGSERFEKRTKAKLDACFAGENIDYLCRRDMVETGDMTLRCRMTPVRDEKGYVFGAMLTLQDVGAVTSVLVG